MANLAQNWAIKTDGTVDGSEYSAKYYAEQAVTTLSNKANIDLSNLSATGEAKFTAKQDVISDLSTIRSGASAGATAVQPADLISYALDNTVAHLAETETITGAKTFTSKLTTAPIELYPIGNSTKPYIDFHYNNSSSDYTSRIIESTQNHLTIESGETILKSYGSGDGQFRIISMSGNYGMIFRFDTSDNLYIFPTAQNDAYGSWDSVSKGLAIQASTGDVRAKGENGKGLIIADIGKSLVRNGYVKLSNGLIIQWGFVSATGSQTVTFPTAFTSNNMSVVLTPSKPIDANSYTNMTSTTTTNFTCITSDWFHWVAIGY